jgi:hypothetical protein
VRLLSHRGSHGQDRKCVFTGAARLQLRFGAIAWIDPALRDQFLQAVVIQRKPFTLAIGPPCTADARPLVPFNPQSAEVVKKIILEDQGCSDLIHILDAEDESPSEPRAKSQLKRAVRALPTWGSPVGDGANRSRIRGDVIKCSPLRPAQRRRPPRPPRRPQNPSLHSSWPSHPPARQKFAGCGRCFPPSPEDGAPVSAFP